MINGARVIVKPHFTYYQGLWWINRERGYGTVGATVGQAWNKYQTQQSFLRRMMSATFGDT